jgi:small subunit ribosomal protein S21
MNTYGFYPEYCYAEGVTGMTNIRVDISENFPADKAIKKFKRQCDSYGIVKEYRKRQEYKKPSVRLKEKTEAAEKRRRKTAGKMRRFSKI